MSPGWQEGPVVHQRSLLPATPRVFLGHGTQADFLLFVTRGRHRSDSKRHLPTVKRGGGAETGFVDP